MAQSRVMGAVLAAVLLFGGDAGALIVGTPSVLPGTVVPLGTVVTISVPVFDDESILGQIGQMPAPGFCSPLGMNSGALSMYPSDSMVMTDALPLSGDPDFNYGNHPYQVVMWQFTASRTGTVDFSLEVFETEPFLQVRGCNDVCGCDCGPGCGITIPSGINVCGFATVTVTSSLTGRLEARSTDYANRPAGQAYVGDTVEAVMSITNTGTNPIEVRYAVCATIATMSNAVLSPPVLEPSFVVPVSLPSQGDDAFLTWRYDATPAGAGSQVVFRADAEGMQAYSGTLYITAAPLDVSVTIYVDPDGSGPAVPVLAGPFFYFLQDENEVRATVTNTSAYSLTVDPSCLPPSMGSGYADFISAATRVPAPGPVPIAASGSQTFTWRYALDRAGYFAWCQGDYGDASFAVTARGAAGIARQRILDHPFTLSVESPPAAQTGKGFSATLWLTNASDREAVLDPSATPFIDFDVPGLVTAVGGPFPAPPVTLDPGESVAFRFDYTAASKGTEQFRGGISYGEVLCIYAPNLVVTEVVAPCPLDLVFTPTKTVVGNQEPYMLVLEVHNASSCTAIIDYIVPPGATLWSNWLGDPAGGPYPVPPSTVPNGGTCVFTFTVAGRECGQVTWSGTVGGSWDVGCGGLAYAMPYSSYPPVRVRQPAAYSCSAGASVSQAYVGDSVNLYYTIVPFSEASVTEFSISMTVNNSGGASIWVTDEPQVPTVIEGCPEGCWMAPCYDKAVTFTWTITAVQKGSGSVQFTVTASGLDEYSGGPAYSLWDPYACPAYTGPLTIKKPSTLSVELNADDPQPGMHCDVPFEVCISALGDTQVTPGTAVFSVISLDGKGEGYATALTGSPPWPPSQYGVGCNFYNTTLVPTSAGQVVLGLTITGTEVVRGTPLQATAFSDPITITPAAMTATSGGPNSYNTANTISGFYVSMSVGNSGMVPGVILDVTPRPDILPCLAGTWAGLPLALVALSTTNYEPSPRTVYGCGDRKGFSWNYATGPGSDGAVAFSMTVTGWTQEGGTVYVGTVTPCVRVYDRPPPYVRMAGVDPVNVFRGRDVTLTIELVNSGETAVKFNRNDTIPGDQIFSMTPNLSIKTRPPASTVVPAGSSARVTAVLGVGNSMPYGPAQAALVPQASSSIYTFGGLFQTYTYNGGTKSWVASWANIDVLASGDPARFNIIPSESSMTISENPYRPLAGPLAINYRLPEGGKVGVKVYTITGELARNVFEGEQAPGEYTLLWDGRNGSRQVIASGIYFLRFESRGLKTTKKLAVLK